MKGVKGLPYVPIAVSIVAAGGMLLLLATLILSEAASADDAIHMDDWDVTMDTTLRSTDVNITGNLTIHRGATLLLDSVTVTFDPDADGVSGLTVMGGGRLVANWTTFASNHTNATYWFRAPRSSALELNNCTVGGTWCNGAFEFEDMRGGLQLDSDSVWIAHCTISGGSGVGVTVMGGSPLLDNTTIEGIRYCTYAKPTGSDDLYRRVVGALALGGRTVLRRCQIEDVGDLDSAFDDASHNAAQSRRTDLQLMCFGLRVEGGAVKVDRTSLTGIGQSPGSARVFVPELGVDVDFLTDSFHGACIEARQDTDLYVVDSDFNVNYVGVIYTVQANTTIRDCYFVRNTREDVYATGGNLSVEGCQFQRDSPYHSININGEGSFRLASLTLESERRDRKGIGLGPGSGCLTLERVEFKGLSEGIELDRHQADDRFLEVWANNLSFEDVTHPIHIWAYNISSTFWFEDVRIDTTDTAIDVGSHTASSSAVGFLNLTAPYCTRVCTVYNANVEFYDSNVSLENCTFNTDCSSGYLKIFHRLTARVMWQSGAPIAGADLDIIVRSLGTLLASGTTDAEGLVSWEALLQEWAHPDPGHGEYETVYYNLKAKVTVGDVTYSQGFTFIGPTYVDIIVVDTVRPWLVVDAPGDDALLNTTRVVVEGRAWDDFSGVARVVVSVDGGDPLLATGTSNWTVDLELTEGAHKLRFWAVDRASLESIDDLLNVTVDLTPPTIVLDPPADEVILTNSSEVTVTGRTEPGASVLIDSAWQRTPDGAFTMTLDLGDDKPYRFDVRVRDEAGNENLTHVTAIRDTRPPSIIIDNPGDGHLTNLSSVVVRGRAEPDASVFFGTEEVENEAGQFEFEAELEEGENGITVRSVDPTGNVGTCTVRVVRDSTPPVVEVVAPVEGSLTNLTAVSVEGSVSEPGVSVTVDGVGAMMEGTSFQFSMDVPEGALSITVRAVDEAGNAATVLVSITVDRTPPPLSVTSPGNGYYRSVDVVVLNGTTEPGATVTINGDGVECADGSFHIDTPVSELGRLDGTLPIEVLSTDAAGNVARYSTAMVLDDLAPEVHVDPLPEWVSEGTVLVTGRVTDDCGVYSLVCNGGPVTLEGDGGFSLELEVPEGGVDIHLVATDLAGNEATWSDSVDLRKTTLPTGGWLVLALVVLVGCATALAYYGRRG